MDFLDVLAKAEELGGETRREALMQTIIKARNLGCESTPGGGKIGGINIRYGSLKYAIMDVNTRGEVFLHIKPHPNKEITDEQKEEANLFLTKLDGIEIKNAPVNHYGQANDPIEDIPDEAIDKFLERCVSFIRKIYYDPHMD
jgi:hypothetical protein